MRLLGLAVAVLCSLGDSAAVDRIPATNVLLVESGPTLMHHMAAIDGFSVPSTTNTNNLNEACKDLVNRTLGPLEHEQDCTATFLELQSHTSVDCSRPCFSKFMAAYLQIETAACLLPNQLPHGHFQDYVCKQSGAPSHECDSVFSGLVERLKSECGDLLQALDNNDNPAGFCGTSCFALYMQDFDTLWGMNCFIWDSTAQSPSDFREATCPTVEQLVGSTVSEADPQSPPTETSDPQLQTLGPSTSPQNPNTHHSQPPVASLLPEEDVYGCRVREGFQWCEAKLKCVSDFRDCPVCTRNCFGNGNCVRNGVCECFRGFTGPSCHQSCPNKCHSRGNCLANLTCTCDEGFKGSECQYTLDEEIPGPTNDCPGYPMCSGKGICIGHECQCNLGYGGKDCSVHIFETCVAACRDHGETCVMGKCICARGFSGKQCELVIGCRSKNFCSGHGICTDKTETCMCEPGWEGDDCSVKTTCPDSCSGQGVCQKNGTCICNHNFFGDNCESVRGSCPAGCSGAGKCDGNTGICACERGFDGSDCGHLSLPSVCQRCKHGTCVFGSRNGTHCRCHRGWGGERCDKVTACAHLHFCNGRGTCNTNQTCDCFVGFTGRECNHILAPCGLAQCSGHGRCEVHRKFNTSSRTLEITSSCNCDPEFSGPNCENSKCLVNNDGLVCSGHGVCDIHEELGPKCTCDTGYVGQDCSEQDRPCPGDPVCSGRGGCVDGFCVCTEDFEGENCEFKARLPLPASGNSCCPLNCSDNGKCVDCACQCDEGWSGVGCSVFKDGAQE